MKKTTILLVRHGQSEGNILNVFTGHSGYPLTELGHKQAEMTAQYISKKYAVDGVYCSDLPRAFQTAEHIAHAFALPVVTDARLREINAGAWENKPFADLPNLFPESFAIWLDDLVHARCTNGESCLEVAERAVHALRNIAEVNPGKCLVVVAHATTIRAALWMISGASEVAMQKLGWGGNCAVSEIAMVDGELKLVSANYTGHLTGFETALPKNL